MSFRTIGKTIRRIFLLILMALTLLGSYRTAPAFAQESQRKVKTRVEPIYPEIAKRMGLTGTVRLQVVVAANGTVKETKVIGGHPILVNAAVDAVKKWRFEAAGAETSGMLEIKFDPGT